MSVEGCTCPVPFIETSFACGACDDAWIAARLAADETLLPADDDHEAYARRQG